MENCLLDVPFIVTVLAIVIWISLFQLLCSYVLESLSIFDLLILFAYSALTLYYLFYLAALFYYVDLLQ